MEKLPAGHSEHALAFTADDQLPGAQRTHVGGPVALAGYVVPGGHVYGAHTGALLPAGGPAVWCGHSCAMHVAALIAFAVGDHVPAGHGVQSIAEVAPGA